MKPVKYRKKSGTIVDAMQLTGENADDVMEWLEKSDARFSTAYRRIIIHSQAGEHTVINQGDHITKDKKGFHSCKADVFKKTYEAVK
jgi:hypothetical protein